MAKTPIPSLLSPVVLLLLISPSLNSAAKEEECGPQSQEVCMADTAGKSSWPKLQGQTKEHAEEVLKREAPDCSILFIPDGSMVTMDFREDRIRVFIKDDLVVRAPNRG